MNEDPGCTASGTEREDKEEGQEMWVEKEAASLKQASGGSGVRGSWGK